MVCQKLRWKRGLHTCAICASGEGGREGEREGGRE